MATPFIPQSLLDSLGTNLEGALSGNFTPAKDPWQGYTPQVQTGPAPGSAEWNSSQGWKDVLSTAVKAAGNPTTQNVGGLGGLGGLDMNSLLSQLQQGQQSQMAAWQKSQTDMMSEWQKALGANFGKTYNPTGVGGSFSNVNSPVYRPGGQTDTGTQAANGWGGSWGNGPFRATF